MLLINRTCWTNYQFITILQFIFIWMCQLFYICAASEHSMQRCANNKISQHLIFVYARQCTDISKQNTQGCLTSRNWARCHRHECKVDKIKLIMQKPLVKILLKGEKVIWGRDTGKKACTQYATLAYVTTMETGLGLVLNLLDYFWVSVQYTIHTWQQLWQIPEPSYSSCKAIEALEANQRRDNKQVPEVIPTKVICGQRLKRIMTVIMNLDSGTEIVFVDGVMALSLWDTYLNGMNALTKLAGDGKLFK